MATPEQNPYNTYLGNGVTTEFSIGFDYTNTSSVKVYIKRSGGEEELLPNTDYSFVNATTIKFPASGSTEAILAVGDVMTIQRETPVENDFVFSNQKRLFPEDVMEADDNEMRILQEHARQLGRALVLGPTSQVNPDEVLEQVERVYDSIDNVDTVADNIGDVNSVSDNMTKISTVSTNIANVNSVADNISDVNTVAGIASAVSNVSSIASDVSDVASIKTDVQNVNSISGDIEAVSDNLQNISTVVDNITDIGSVAQNISNVNAVADNATNINAVNANKTNINAVAGNATNINSVAGNSSNINTVAGSAANINTVATNVSAVNNCSTNMADIQAAPGAASDAAASAEESRVWATGDDDEVAEYEQGEHSSHTYASLAMAIANTPEDVPVIDGIDALNVIRGPKGDPGSSAPNGGTTGQVLTKRSNADGDTYWATVGGGGGGAVNDVQINSTSIVSGGVANIPLASQNVFGVSKINSTYGVAITSGVLYINKAADNELVAKANNYKSVVPANLDVAIREGLGNNGLTWSDAYKASARNTIGAEAQSTIQILSATDSITLADNTIYNGGEQTALTIALPATDTIGFLCEVDFSSGNTATTLSYSLPDIFWEGTDVAYDSTAQKNIFKPVANKRYTIVFYYDGVNYNGRVGGV